MASVFAIGIAGGTCSGKTTLATALCARLGSETSVVLSMDHFYREQSEKVLASGIVNFEHPGALDLESLVAAFESLCSGATKFACLITTGGRVAFKVA
jgi:uridine kinase